MTTISELMAGIQQNRNVQYGLQCSNHLRRLTFVFLASLLGLFLSMSMSVAVAGENVSAKERVMDTIDQVMRILSDQPLQAPEQA